jgi:heme-degrading monooxygenase HmoA
MVAPTKGADMYARTSTWSGSPDSLEKWTSHCETKVRAFVEGVPGNSGVMFFVDRENGQALTLTLWDSEQAATASDQYAEQSRESTVAATGAELIARGRYEVVAGG